MRCAGLLTRCTDEQGESECLALATNQVLAFFRWLGWRRVRQRRQLRREPCYRMGPVVPRVLQAHHADFDGTERWYRWDHHAQSTVGQYRSHLSHLSVPPAFAGSCGVPPVPLVPPRRLSRGMKR
jgi:hypothetical protein